MRDTRLAEGVKMKHTKQTTYNMPCILMFLCSCALLLLCSSALVQAEVLPKTARLIPPETVLLVDIDDFSRLKQQFEKTNLYKLYKDPAMAAFIDDFKDKQHERFGKMNNEFVRTIVDAEVLPQGRAAVALVLNEQTKDANEPPFLFITQWGENIAKTKETVNKITQKAVEDGSHRKTEDYRGVSITTITQQPTKTMSYCFIDDCLIGSMNLDILKFVIAHIKGATSPTLAGDTDYIATIKAVGPYHDIDFYVNIKQIIKATIAEDTTGTAKATIANLGIDNVISLGGSIGLARILGGSSCAKAVLKINGSKKGICKMLDIESAAIRAPRFISSSTYSATFIHLNINKAYSELSNILNSFSPQLAAIINMPLLPPGPQGEPPLQLKTDIINHFAPQIAVATSIDMPLADNSTKTESLVALAVNNRSALEKSLSLLHSKVIAPNNPEARRELLGHTIYTLDILAMLPTFLPGKRTPMQAPLEMGREERQPHCRCGLLMGQAPAGPSTPKMTKLAFTVTDTHLVFASESAVERAIRALSSAETTSVGSAKWFNQAKSIVPSVVGLACLEDNSASGKFLWEMLKKNDKSKDKDSSLQMGVSMNSKSLFPHLMFSQTGFDLFNPGLLPEFDTVRKYFGLSAFYGISTPDGFFFEFKYLNPD